MVAQDIDRPHPCLRESLPSAPGLRLLSQAAGEFSASTNVATAGPNTDQARVQEVVRRHRPFFLGPRHSELQGLNEAKYLVPTVMWNAVQFIKNVPFADA